jgi:hypothetical protein
MVVSGAGQAGAWKAIVRHDDIGVMRSFRANIALACSLDGSRRFDLGLDVSAGPIVSRVPYQLISIR